MTNQKSKYKEALTDAYGTLGIKYFEDAKKGIFHDDTVMPMVESIINISEKTIFHNHWSKMQVKDNNISVISLAAVDLNSGKKACDTINIESNLKIKLNDVDILIGCFGYVNKNKRPNVILDSLEQILTRNRNVKLAFFGKLNDDSLNKLIKEKKLEKNVVITGYLDEMEYLEALNRTDIVINLRYPSMGESSATLLEAFKFGKPVIVSEINQYKEFPDDVCWKVSPDKYEVAVLTEMLTCLVENKDIRTALGDNAKAYADEVLSPEYISKQYYKVIMEEI